MQDLNNHIELRELHKEVQGIEARTTALEQHKRRTDDRYDELSHSVGQVGERVRGVHSVALDGVAGVNAARERIDHVDRRVSETIKRLDAIQLLMEKLVRGKKTTKKKPRRDK